VSIEPEFNSSIALAPFQTLAMRVVYCPIDPRLNFQEASNLIKEIQPKQIVTHSSYITSLSSLANSNQSNPANPSISTLSGQSTAINTAPNPTQLPTALTSTPLTTAASTATAAQPMGTATTAPLRYLITYDSAVITFKHLDVLSITSPASSYTTHQQNKKRNFEKATMSMELAQHLQPQVR